MGYEAFVIDEQTRSDLLQRFPPKFPDVICHHVTNLFVKKQADRPFGQRFAFAVVGYASDDKCEALVVARSGSAVRPDGGTYHITLSVNRSKGAKPFDSNTLIAKGYERVSDPFTFPTTFEYLDS